MAIEAPARNKMMQAAPTKKGFHFASDGIHMAEFIEAETIEEATEIYHKIKRVIGAGGTVSTPARAEVDEKTV